jgi:DNA-binding NtrC family response regulator
MQKPKPTVAIFNTSEDVVELFRVLLEAEGFNTTRLHITDIERGNVDMLKYLSDHDPAAIIYDIAPPYEQSWNVAKQLLDMKAMQHRKVIFTTTNKRRLEAIIGEVHPFEIAQKPYDFQQVVEAVKKALGV